VIVTLYLVKPIHTQHGVHENLHIKRNIDAIHPARLEANGVPVICEKGQAAMGFLLERAQGLPGAKEKATLRDFVPMGNVASVSFEPTATR